ncbi:UDP-N-acetylmuramoyl-L-alanine--D-glutamate ligase [Pseudohongiella spirulinae]|uniref:UDP-N-acetylmuramoylalanine--D-glutamate ligase n=1 Tax=Pseudohongiella spirulinae TaxID=1249552 RepID=A0A0S2KFX2_9GAMM|nr:UDP-N-acetylmuramoyl-L-alanine--D-glutamate ligase [Pseudohongiella spirulinae]ALO46932.1 UDP-N-acetylmuramoylalanine--D-glutamate ligase [Pseudohongiella spirulinae]
MSDNNAPKFKVIVGLGKTGLSCARYFHERGEAFRVIDNRFSPPCLPEFEVEFPFAEVELGEFSESTLMEAGEIVLSPGVSKATPEIAKAIAAGVSVTGDIDIFSRAAKAPIVAVTGSNGKSTVVTLVAEMARQSGLNIGVGGNLDGRASVPALDLLRLGNKDLYILELSSFQLETTTKLGAEVATILNISEDHLDRYESMSDYIEAKKRIFRSCHQAVINRDETPELYNSLTAQQVVCSFGSDEPGNNQLGVVLHERESWVAMGDHLIMPARDIRLPGRHNLSNAMAAFALGQAVGISESAMVTTLREFGGLPHRCQHVRNLRGVDYYNDSKGTNVGATLVAIQAVAERTRGELVLIAGGVGKGADFSPLLPLLDKYVKRVILIGKDAPLLASVIKDSTDIMRASSIEEAVLEAAESANDNDAVLLSPACASYDMFKDFAHRGRAFVAAVEALS